MEQAVRHLREGAVAHAAGASFALICSDQGSVGTHDLMYQLVADYTEALHQQRAQATHMRLLLLDGSMAAWQPTATISVLDGWSDPAGWLSEKADPVPSLPGRKTVTVTGPDSLQQLLSALTDPAPNSSGQASLAIVVDSLSPVLQYHSAAQVLRFMEELRHHKAVSCILSSVQLGVSGSAAGAGLQRMATCLVHLGHVSGLQQEVLSKAMRQEAHGVASFAFKPRRAGRMRSETVFFQLLPGGQGVYCFQPPPELASLTTAGSLVSLLVQQNSKAARVNATAVPGALTATAGVPPFTAPAHSVGAGRGEGTVQPARPHGLAGADLAAGLNGAAELSQAVAGGMRLTLTQEEVQARQAVVLPYEHKGGNSAYGTGDWKDYLPLAAGGRLSANHSQRPAGTIAQEGGPRQASIDTLPVQPGGQQQLGSILYVRDSDSENGGLHDSDEDPDDDLDL